MKIIKRLTKTDAFIGTYINAKIISIGEGDSTVETAYIGEPIDLLSKYEDLGTIEELLELKELWQQVPTKVKNQVKRICKGEFFREKEEQMLKEHEAND